MAYYSGTATSLANLLANFLTNAQADGWTLTGNVLSKAGVYFQLTSDANNVNCLGCESNAVGNPAPNAVMIGRIHQTSLYGDEAILFPCNYEVFGFAQEIYLVVNYSVDRYQWMAFGKSTVPGLAGQGGWVAASVGAPVSDNSAGGAAPVSIAPGAGGDQNGYQRSCAAPFWYTTGFLGAMRNCWVNHNLDAHGWTWNGAANDNPIGIRWLTTLISIQPNVWNSEAVLLPVRAYKQRASYKSSMVVDLAFARHLRIDNLAPGNILTIGSDKWKVFPYFKKNSAARDGSITGASDTGTFGWAIKYEGP